jgi:mannitol/fructose-specific phosphotransferase system IIA component (Ntr-type)
MAVVLSDLLDERHVTLELKARTRPEALREIVSTMTTGDQIRDPKKFIAEVAEREKLHPSFMGNGVALPHLRTDLVEEIVLGIGRSREGIPFGEKAEPAHLIFLVGVPKRMVTDYLVCVGALARLTKGQADRARLMQSETAAELIELLRTGSLLLE